MGNGKISSCAEAMFYEDGSPCIEHYGILGMKWGVRNAETRRRYANEGRSSAKADLKETVHKRVSQKIQVHNIKRKRKAANRNRSTLSDAELDRRIKRLQKEKQLNDLTRSELQPGREFVKKLLVGGLLTGVLVEGVKEGGKIYVSRKTKERLGIPVKQ